MQSNWYLRLLMVFFVVGLGVYFLYPSYFFYTQANEEQRNSHEAFCKALPSGMPCAKFNLGLDLQGGVHLVMGVKVEKAVEQRADRLGDALMDGLKEAKIPFARIDRPRDTADIKLSLTAETKKDELDAYLRRDFGVIRVVRREDQVWTLALVDSEQSYIKKNAVEQAIKTIRNRADKLGVSEPSIAARGSDSIVIQLPGVKDPEQALDVIGRTAQLEFKIVDSEATAVFDEIAASDLPAGVKKQEATYEGPGGKAVREVFFELPKAEKEKVMELLQSKVPANREIAFGELEGLSDVQKSPMLRTYLLNSRPGITGDYLTDAKVQPNSELPNDYNVVMHFDPKGAQIFERLTEENVQRHMAIVLDGTVNSAPNIQEKIGGGTARITLGRGGNVQRKLKEAEALAIVLKAGALPAPVEIREKRQVGETLGRDAIRGGSNAALIGLLLTVLFMAIYYKGSGMLANLALALNMLLLLAAMALFGATLTLPGIAGMVLTVGMAVDANVIIFERIREELKIGKTPRAAVESGYDKAFWAIFDSNITNLIAGVVLMQYGSGPVRGFAVTTIIGIVSSMFTAIVVTRLVFDYFTNRPSLRALSI